MNRQERLAAASDQVAPSGHSQGSRPLEKTSSPLDRRAVLGLGGALATVGAWSQASAQSWPEPADPTPGVEFVYEALVTLDATTPVGQTPLGKRNRMPISGGSFKGPRIAGKVLAGGMDWQLIREDGFTMIEADYMMQADDGALIRVINKGLVGAAPGQGFYARTTPWFEAPNGPHVWLNQAVFVGTVGPAPGQPASTVKIRVFKIV
jgi:hypothetical protein